MTEWLKSVWLRLLSLLLFLPDILSAIGAVDLTPLFGADTDMAKRVSTYIAVSVIILDILKRGMKQRRRASGE